MTGKRGNDKVRKQCVTNVLDEYSKLRVEPFVAIINGAVAQQGERLLCTEEVRGSSPLSSTTSMVLEWSFFWLKRFRFARTNSYLGGSREFSSGKVFETNTRH